MEAGTGNSFNHVRNLIHRDRFQLDWTSYACFYAMSAPAQVQYHTAETRPDLWDALLDPNHPLVTPWPACMEHGETFKAFFEKLLDCQPLQKYQFAAVERDSGGQESMIAYGHSLPFFWPEVDQAHKAGTPVIDDHVLHSLPEGGWETILSRGVRQCYARQGLDSESLAVLTKDQEADTETCKLKDLPNALSAIAITVRADRRGLSLAETLIKTLKQTAQDAGFKAMVVPVRPTKKAEVPFVPMETYVRWTQDKTPPDHSITGEKDPDDRSAAFFKTDSTLEALPFDPWLRKHVRLGGRIVKVAPLSTYVRGSIADWEKWTGLDLRALLTKTTKGVKDDARSNGEPKEISFPGGLAPLKVFERDDVCEYVEPNVWLHHNI